MLALRGQLVVHMKICTSHHGSIKTITQQRLRQPPMDNNVLNTVEKFYPTGLLVDKQAALIVEIDGFECSLDYQQKAVINCFEKHKASGIKFSKTEEEADKIWNARRASYGACTQLKPNVLTDDLIFPRCNMAKLVLGIKSICEKYDLTVCIVGHVGDGNVHRSEERRV